jgi:hypothetical protein
MLRLYPAFFAFLLTSALIPTGSQSQARRSSFEPDTFEFGEGHAYMGSDSVKWDDGRLVVRKRVADMKGKGEFQETVEHLSPPREAWERFWARVDAMGVWKWKADYSSSRSSMPDGESWSLNLKYDTKQVKSKGYNGVPEAYGGFRDAVYDLLKDARQHKSESKDAPKGPGN